MNSSIHSNSLSQAPSAFTMTNTTNPSTTISLSVADNDSRRLAIIFGTMGTMLALASLAFAALTWARSRRDHFEVNSKTRAAIDRALESNELGPGAHEAYELEGSAVVNCVVAGIWYVVSKSVDVSTVAYSS
jgi:hypothetical protein